MSEKYSDKLCQAIDVIVKKRLEEIKPDQVVISTIKEKVSTNEYLVKTQFNEETRAIAENANYMPGDQVYVLSTNAANLIVAKQSLSSHVAVSTDPKDQLIIYGSITNSNYNYWQQNFDRIELKCKKMLLVLKKKPTLSASVIVTINSFKYEFPINEMIDSDTMQQFKFFDLPIEGINNIANISINGADDVDWEIIFGDLIEDYISGTTIDELLMLKTLFKTDYDAEIQVRLMVSWLILDKTSQQYKKQSTISSQQYIHLQHFLNKGQNVETWSNYWDIGIASFELNITLSLNTQQELFQLNHEAITGPSIMFTNTTYQDGQDYNSSVQDENDFYLYVQLNANGRTTSNAWSSTVNQTNYELRVYMYDTYTNYSVAQLSINEIEELQWAFRCQGELNDPLENLSIEKNKFIANLMLEGPSENQYIFGVIKIKVNYKGNIYTEYIPIAWKNNINVELASGAIKVKYNSLGTSPSYLKEKYALTSSESVSWSSAVIGETYNSIYMPTLDGEMRLQPLPSYTDTSDSLLAIFAENNDNEIVWVQPIAIYKQSSTNEGLLSNMEEIIMNIPASVETFTEEEQQYSISKNILLGKHSVLGSGLFLSINNQVIGGLTEKGGENGLGQTLSFVYEGEVPAKEDESQLVPGAISLLTIDFANKEVYYKGKPLSEYIK